MNRCNNLATAGTRRGVNHVKDESDIRCGGSERRRCVILYSCLCCPDRWRACDQKRRTDHYRESAMGWLAWWRLGLARPWMGLGCWSRRCCGSTHRWSACGALLLGWLLRRTLLWRRVLCGSRLLCRTLRGRGWRWGGILHAAISLLRSQYRNVYGQRWPSPSLPVTWAKQIKNPGLTPGFSF